ncbi:WbqC family protein [Lysinibacillus sp. BW-2-10]|uniref:WbqC family protein n=1 Tax=Lysinibacillus sp. BW-2-10 TaxID=2590030 RepID=UPI00117C31DB|nr:WbqC family protein [Lysinibacillus sp. BW-2-10]TSI08691.1 WbqC family protein [Lysinibacillus sp. BW-2-10]
MKIAIHQPNYLPWIGFFDKLDQVDSFVLLDTARHSKSGFVHRNKIKTPSGPLTLSVPLKNKEYPINELLIAQETNWQHQHWKAIETNYKKSPYWSLYKDGFEQIFQQQWSHLSDLNITIIEHIVSLLNISTKLVKESSLHINFGQRNTRNVNIVSHLKGTTYLSGEGARIYNDPLLFKEHQIELIYQQFNHPRYLQRWGEFIPNLSIIDMLFNCGPSTLELIRSSRNG